MPRGVYKRTKKHRKALAAKRAAIKADFGPSEEIMINDPHNPNPSQYEKLKAVCVSCIEHGRYAEAAVILEVLREW